jgi:hypothetical protein
MNPDGMMGSPAAIEVALPSSNRGVIDSPTNVLIG